MTSAASRLDALLARGPAHSAVEENHAFASLRAAMFDARSSPVVVGRYVLLRPAGRGGRGQVFVAFDPRLERNVALKLIATSPSKQDAALDEARTLAGVSHPNVVTVFDAGVVSASELSDVHDHVYLAMELIAGESLGAWIDRSSPSWGEALAAFMAAGRGLAAAHRAGIAHLDFKPSNVMRTHDGEVRVVDFGLATRGHAQRRSASGGTPNYMAPEQHDAVTGDAQSDQFSFCVALHEALYGRVPFTGGTLAELAAAKRRGVLEVPRGRGVPRFVGIVLHRGLSPDPTARFASLEALIAALHRGRRRRRLVQAGVGLTLASLGGAGLWSAAAAGPGCEPAQVALGGAWDAPVRARLQTALAKHGQAANAAPLDEQLDGWVASWSQTHDSACELPDERAASVRACLGRRLEELNAVTTVLGEADPAVLSHASFAVAGLAVPTRCSEAIGDERADANGDENASPQVHRVLARAWVYYDTGQYERARRQLERDLSDIPVDSSARAVGLRILGLAQAQTGDTDRAEQSLLASWLAAERLGQDAAAGWALVRLAWVVGERSGQRDRGEALADAAEAKVARLGSLPGLRAAIETLRGHFATSDRRFDDAAAHYEAAVASRASVFGPDDRRVAEARVNLANALDEMGQHDAARGQYEAAMTTWSRTLAPEHPLMRRARVNLGISRLNAGDAKGAIEQLRRLVEPLDGDDRVVASARHGLGAALLAAGQRQAGVAMLRRAHEITGADARGPVALDLAEALLLVGELDQAAFFVAEAIESLERQAGGGGDLERALRLRDQIALAPQQPAEAAADPSLIEASERAHVPGKTNAAQRL